MNKTILSAFNNTLYKFVHELISSFPAERKFVVFKNAIKLVQKVNPRKVLILFIEYISPYKDKLIQRDEDFFLNNNYINIINKTNASKENAWTLIDKIKVYWKDINQQNKDIIWDYFKVLITLAYKYIA